MTFLDRLLQQWRFRKACPYIFPNARVLDIGSASDAPLHSGLKSIKEFIGIDPDIGISRHISENCQLLKGYFPDAIAGRAEPFDNITMLAVLEHIPESEQSQLATNIARYLAPGGRLIITVPSPAVDSILQALSRLRLVDGMSLEQHYGFDVKSTAPLFENAGLKLVHWERFQLGLNNLFVFEKPTSRTETIATRRNASTVSPILLALLSGILFLLGMLYISHGARTCWLATDSDLHKRRIEQLYVLKGQNPYDVSEAVLAMSEGRPAPSHTGRNSSPDPSIGSYGPGGYPPWAFFVGFGAFLPANIQVTKLWYLVLNFAALGFTTLWAYTLGGSRGFLPKLFLAAATLAMFANGSTLRLGQYGLLVNGCLIGMMRAQAAGSSLAPGLLFAAAMVKPNNAALFGWNLLIRWNLIACISAAASLGLMTAVICSVVHTSPIEMARQMLVQSNSWVQQGISPPSLLMAVGMPRPVATAMVAVVGLIASGGLVYWCRTSPLLVGYAITATIGRLWCYHRQYDDVLLVFPLLQLALNWLDKPSLWRGLLLGLFAATLLVPLRLIDFNSGVQLWMWLTWLVGMVSIVLAAKEQEQGVSPIAQSPGSRRLGSTACNRDNASIVTN